MHFIVSDAISCRIAIWSANYSSLIVIFGANIRSKTVGHPGSPVGETKVNFTDGLRPNF